MVTGYQKGHKIYWGEPDPCLGTLTGVSNACCGHGVVDQSYIQFTNGVVVRHFKIEESQ